MSAWLRRLLRAVQLSPLVAIALIAAVWFAVPAPLAGRMISMATSGVPAFDSFSEGHDRASVAGAYLEKQAEDRARKGWADVQFRAAAHSTWAHTPAKVVKADLDGRLEPFAFGESDTALSPLRAYLLEHPGTHIEAYVVSRPKAPARVLTSIGAPSLLPSAQQLRSLDVTSPYALAWRLSEPTADYPRFLRDAWRTDQNFELPGTQGVRSRPELVRNHFYRTLVLRVPTGTRLTTAEVDRLHGGIDWPEDTSACAACHVPDSTTFHLATDESGEPAQPQPDRQARAAAVWYAGPVDLRAVLQYADRSESDATLTPQALHDAINGASPRPYGMYVWAGETTKDALFEKPTMLFVVHFPGDPHAEFDTWRRAPLTRALMSLRATLAATLPWLLVAGAALLGLTLVGSTAAFRVERRLSARDRAREELERVQRDAHDRIYNRMSALAKRVEQLGVESAETLDHVAEDIRVTLGDLQSILGDSQAPAGAPGSTLVEQLAAIAVAQQARYGVRVVFDADELPTMPARLGWDLQCALEEAITNAARHGHATRVDATVRVADGQLRLRVEDDGDGVGEGAEAGGGRSSGLRGMRARLEQWGGTVELRRAERGAVLEATVPVPKQGRA